MLTEKFVRRAIVNWLSRHGYSRNLREKHTDEHGVDIKVRHNNYARYFLVETKGGAVSGRKVKYPHSQREVLFIMALGQIATRMNTDALYYYGIGLPETYRSKVTKRLPWQFCKKNKLCIFLVSKTGKVTHITWKQLKTLQK